MIPGMERLRFRVPMQVRTTRKMKRAVDHVLADLRGEGIEFNDEPISQEAFINASFLWFEEMGKEAVADAMRRHVPRMVQIMQGESAPAAVPLDGPPATLKTPPSRATVEDFTPPTPRRKQRPG
jgi:hypothetical protein